MILYCPRCELPTEWEPVDLANETCWYCPHCQEMVAR
jgi:hypothetical protein